MASPPRPGIAAYVRDMVHEHEGREVRGTLHFAPGTLVYVHGPQSGDGWERTYITGPHRDDGRMASVLGPRRRLVHHHRRVVTDQAALAALDRRGGYWNTGLFDDLLLAHNEDERFDTRTTGWPDGQWERLSKYALAPSRPHIDACVSRVLDVSIEEARTLLAAGTAGRALREIAKGAPAPGRDPLRKYRDAWEQLAPPSWHADPSRQFLSLDNLVVPAPDSPLAVASFCADPEGIRTAESLARELASRCGLDPKVPVAWHVVSRNEAHQRVQRLPWSLDIPPLPARVPTEAVPTSPLGLASVTLASVLRSLSEAQLEWRRVALTRLATLPGVDPDPLKLFAPLFELMGHGYALCRLEPERIVLLCPVLPTASR